MPRLETKRYRCSAFGRSCDFPALSAERQPHRVKSTIADYEGLFIDYGYRETSYPYTQQNDYTDEAERDVPVAVLENEFLYAEFLPTLGGIAPAHLEFCADDDVTPWMELLSKKPLSAPLSFAYGARQEALLLENADFCEWSVPYQLGLLCYDRRAFEKAKAWCEKSLLLDSNPKNLHLYAFVLYQLRSAHFSYFVRKALLQKPNDYGLCESLFSLLLHAEDYVSLIESFPQLSGDLQGNARLCMYLAGAYLGAGDARRAEEILLSDGGLQLRDYREGDRMLDTLYRGIRKALYHETDAQITVPEQFDFIVADFGGEKDG